MYVYYIYVKGYVIYCKERKKNIFLPTILQTTNIKLKCKMILKSSFSCLMKVLNNFKSQFILVVVITCVRIINWKIYCFYQLKCNKTLKKISVCDNIAYNYDLIKQKKNLNLAYIENKCLSTEHYIG